MIYYNHGTAESRLKQFLEVSMKKGWILLDSCGYGETMWEENSTLCWCGCDTYAIVWTREAYQQNSMNHIEFYNASQVKEAWKNEQAYYDYYITT